MLIEHSMPIRRARAALAALACAAMFAGGACGEEEPLVEYTDWCGRVQPGPPGARDIAVDLSAAHAQVRFFGVEPSYSASDQALAAALAAPDSLEASGIGAALEEYVAGLATACVVPADADADASVGEARVELIGDVAVVHPGAGEIAIPAEARAIAIDLRDVASVPELGVLLDAALAPALDRRVTGAVRQVRYHHGMRDEVFSGDNTYGGSVQPVGRGRIPAAAGGADRPLAVFTDATLAPEAAELAITLRLAGRAWILGASVRTEVAESRWIGIGQYGIVHRNSVLQGERAWPDELAADLPADDPTSLLADLAAMGRPGDTAGGPAQRPSLDAVLPFDDIQPAALDRGDAVAGLIIAHGALRLFFPYFAITGDVIDERLLETIESVDASLPLTRRSYTDILNRLGEAIDDGHQRVIDKSGESPSAGVLPVWLDEIDGYPVVRRSLEPLLQPGDTIIAVDGTAIEQWLATQYARTSAASEGYRFRVALRRGLLRMTGPISLDVRDVGGTSRTITVEPHPSQAEIDLGYTPSLRASGRLDDLGAPGVHYINLSDAVITSMSAFSEQLDAAVAGASGLILDMRGYPGGDIYAWARRLSPENFSSPQFWFPTYHGPDSFEQVLEQYELPPLAGPKFDGPVALLVGDATVSAAENFSQMIKNAMDMVAVGRPSAATNGNITGVQLPGAMGFTFTGMEVRNPRGSQFHGIGIVPEVVVVPTAASNRRAHNRVAPETQRSYHLAHAAGQVVGESQREAGHNRRDRADRDRAGDLAARARHRDLAVRP